MKRLTFEGNFCDLSMCRETPCPYNGACSQRKVWERLKEYEDREEQGCEFCDGTDTDLYFQEGACRQMNDHVYISGYRMECDFGCKAWGAFDIKFCPMCGRKLGGAEG